MLLNTDLTMSQQVLVGVDYRVVDWEPTPADNLNLVAVHQPPCLQQVAGNWTQVAGVFRLLLHHFRVVGHHKYRHHRHYNQVYRCSQHNKENIAP